MAIIATGSNHCFIPAGKTSRENTMVPRVMGEGVGPPSTLTVIAGKKVAPSLAGLST